MLLRLTSLAPPYKVAYSGSVSVTPGGGYEGTVMTRAAGGYNLSLVLDGRNLSSTALTVVPGPLFVGTTRVAPPPAVAVAGAPFGITVDARDGFSNACAAADLAFDVVLTAGGGAPDAIAAAALGPPFTAELIASRAGDFNVTVSERSSGAVIQGSPFQITVLPAVMSPSASSLLGPVVGDAGREVVFAVVPRDAFGNLVSAALGANFSATLSEGASRAPPPVTQIGIQLANGTSSPVGITAAGLGDVPAGAIFLSFTPTVAGTLLLAVQTGGAHVGGSLRALQVQLAPSPAVLAASFDQTLRAFQVKFDVGVQVAGQGGPAAPSADCETTLDHETLSLLGTGALCKWPTRRQLAVYLGAGASLLPVDLGTAASSNQSIVGFLPGAISAAAYDSHPLAGQVAVGPPAGSARPIRVALQASSAVFGACDSLTLDASATPSTYGRQLAFAFRAGAANGAVSPGLTDLLRAQSGGPVLVVPPGVLTPGAAYVFAVHASDAFGNVASASMTVTQSAAPVPSAAILVPAGAAQSRSLSISGARGLQLSSALAPPAVSCLTSGQRPAAVNVTFSWRQLAGPQLSNFSLPPTRTLFVPPSALTSGATYTFAFVASLAGRPNTSATDCVDVHVTAAPQVPGVALLGGQNRSASVAATTALQACGVDPHLPAGGASCSSFIYSWSCQVAGAQGAPSAALPTMCPPQVLAAVASTSSDTLSFPPYSFLAGIYQISVSAARSRGLGLGPPAHVYLSLGEGDAPGVAVSWSQLGASDSAGSLDNSRDVEVHCTTSGEPYSYAWSLVDGDGATGLNVSDAPLVIPANTLTAGGPSTFRCDLFPYPPTGAPISSASLTLPRAQPPWGGSLAVRPAGGGDPTGGHLYSFLASDWTAEDEDLPLTYAFSYSLAGAGRQAPVLLAPPSASNRLSALLPAGTLAVAVTVASARGAWSHADAPGLVTVAPAGSPALLVPQALLPAVALGDLPRVLQLADIWGRAAAAGGYVAATPVSATTSSAHSRLWARSHVATSSAAALTQQLAQAAVSFAAAAVLTPGLLEQAACALSRLAAVPQLLGPAAQRPLLGFAADGLEAAAGQDPSLYLTSQGGQCYMELLSGLLLAANQSAPGAVRSAALQQLVPLPARVASAVLKAAARGQSSLDVVTPAVALVAAKVGMQSAPAQGRPDFAADAGGVGCHLNVTDPSVPGGSDVVAVFYAFTGVNPLPFDPQVDGQVAVVQALYSGTQVNFEVSLAFPVASTEANVDVRQWDGTTWSAAGLAQAPAALAAEVNATAASSRSMQAFAPYRETVPYSRVPLLPIGGDAAPAGFHPNALVLILSVALPPLVMAAMVAAGLVATKKDPSLASSGQSAPQ